NVTDADSKVFFDEFANVYGPELHKRGTKIVPGLDYRELLKVPTTKSQPTEKEFDDYSKELLDKYMTRGIYGIDFYM
ncbi:EndoS/ChiA family endoglycosidase, partial [Enterococcus gallinarum]